MEAQDLYQALPSYTYFLLMGWLPIYNSYCTRLDLASDNVFIWDCSRRNERFLFRSEYQTADSFSLRGLLNQFKSDSLGFLHIRQPIESDRANQGLLTNYRPGKSASSA
jgi:hypothetical protein